MTNALQDTLGATQTLMIRQKKELAELFGYETRNKYSIETEDGVQIGFAAEQQKGFFGFLFRQLAGHYRPFSIQLYDSQRNHIFTAEHPFRFYYHTLTITDPQGQPLGTISRRFSMLTKCFDLHDASGALICSVDSPLWRVWTFNFMAAGQTIAKIEKKWGGFLREGFLDADNFKVSFLSQDLSINARQLLLAAGLFIDLMYFEAKAN